ncbi:MAG: nucleotidyltransferase domain-containing protein [Anaerolineae bacterium]
MLEDHRETVRTYRQIAKDFARLLERELGEQLVSVVLYGSVARQDAQVGSDIDMLVVVDAPSREERKAVRERVGDLVFEFENNGLMEELFQQGRLVDLEYRLYTKEEAQRTHIFYLDLTQDAMLLLDRDGFFAAKLEQVRQRMRELGTRRVYFEDGCWYWDLKPGMQPGEVVEL